MAKHGVQKKKNKHATKPLSLNVDGCEPGTVKVVAFDNGKAVAEQVRTGQKLIKLF
jgi:hypothetical protein